MIKKAHLLHQKGELVEAASLYRKILAKNPRNADALHRLGVIEAQNNNYFAAIELIDRAIKASPRNAQFFSDRGIALTKLERFEEALASYDHALFIKSDYAEALNNRGVVLRKLKRLDDALASYDRALAIKPDYAEALNNRGIVLQELKRFDHALVSYARALAIKPQYAEAFYNRGRALHELKRFEDALANYARAVAIRPDYAEALNNSGLALQQLKRFAEALASCDRALAIKPNFADAFHNRGTALQELKRSEEAVASYDHALAIKPDHAEALNDRGVALQQLERFEKAIANYDRALAIRPDYAEAFHNRGVALQELRRFEDALTSYDHALAIKPNYAEAFHNRGMLRLLNGKFREGWSDCEWRWHTDDCRGKPRVKAREWQGEELAGCSILIYAEQGRGDVIQFARYLPLLLQRGASVSFLLPVDLIRLFRSLDPEIKLISALDDAGALDFQCALMSLPLRFGTEVLSVPNKVPYLCAEPDLVARWKARIGQRGFKVGIAWQGNPLARVDRHRSIPLAEFVPLSGLAGVRLISLQKQHGLDQVARLPPEVGIEVLGEDCDGGPNSFIDTAAVMQNLDLIVTSDTSIAHLAGALARPTWVALRDVPDWRWMLDRRDSPWYPTMRLFRQKTVDVWQCVFAAIEEDLQSLLAAGKKGRYCI